VDAGKIGRVLMYNKMYKCARKQEKVLRGKGREEIEVEVSAVTVKGEMRDESKGAKGE
jgi:hypothetical protein